MLVVACFGAGRLSGYFFGDGFLGCFGIFFLLINFVEIFLSRARSCGRFKFYFLGLKVVGEVGVVRIRSCFVWGSVVFFISSFIFIFESLSWRSRVGRVRYDV